MENTSFKKQCPQCFESIFYSTAGNHKKAVDKNKICTICIDKNIIDKNRELIEDYLTDNEEINKQIVVIFETDPNKKRFMTNVSKFLRSDKIKKILNTRKCPTCKSDIVHTNSSNKKQCEGKNCKKCTNLELSKSNSLRTGDKNPFFGKTHSEESMNKMLRTKKVTKKNS